MFRENRERPCFDFPGISVITPKQSGRNIVAVHHGIDPRVEYDDGDFHVFRVVANIAIYDWEDTHNEAPLEEFDPPIEIRVAYHLIDLVKSDFNLDILKLAYWNGNLRKWHILNRQVDKYEIFPPSTGQFAQARIVNWYGDPPIAWGR